MNAAIVFSSHGSIGEILKKHSGSSERVSEFLLIKEYSKVFDRVFVFSHDNKDYGHILPKNCVHMMIGNRLLYMLFGWMKVLRNSRKHGFRVIRVVGSAGLPLVFMANRLSGARVIIKYYYLWHNASGNAIKRKLIKAAESLLKGQVDHVIAGNQEVRDFIGDKKKILPINEGIIMSNITSAKPSKKLEAIKGKKAIYIGRLTEIKDPLTLIRAHKIASKSFRDFHLIICGDGPLMEECKKEAGSNVHFLGFVKDVPALLKGSDMFVLTSRYDASPRVIMEAMGAGIPSIATAVGGVPEYLGKCGILVKPGDPEGLAKEMVRLLENTGEAKRLGKAAKERALEMYSLEKNLDKEIRFIKERYVR